jgi:hypothetical protein
MARHGEDEEWLPVLRPIYAAARLRHARTRADAYHITRFDAVKQGVCGPELRVADIDAHTLNVWERTWHGVHPSGAGSWNWRVLVDNLPHRAAVLPFAVWYGDDLCGLALGQVSRRRFTTTRHTVTLTFVERRPEPPEVPLHGKIILLATEVAENYGIIIGARRLRLRAPDRNLLAHYEKYGFVTMWKGKLPLYCEREIRP